MNEALRAELIRMKDYDLEVRQRLLDEGKLGGFYVPEMEAVHRQNSARLREIIAEHGWPHEEIAGEDGAKAAWLIAQHAIGEPDFQRQSLQYLQRYAAEGKLPAWQAAYIEDRIAIQEGRPQRYGTQWIDDIRDGLTRPLPLEDPERVNELRASVGLGPLHPIPPPGPDLPEEMQKQEQANRDAWEAWFVRVGWRKG
ncbi:hypothetical protein H7849_07910 [Alloacidobacterium dinghuense]|uniref:Uncharacterized protein n=1 Tax=Alloacidobacterium dinghuense TaxID=2763107 RepID=A0A7G8BMQ9_9BACT|nr:DUF6624 domain-containing protein [Alloacidobacterium dinghuense]QNI33829.1 hypothetical protein H7849_07910 [Alloacidobacterium dinghuense]